jgi:hypothetical protein
MAGHRAGGREEVSVGCIIATVHFSCACCGKIDLRRSGSADCWSHARSSSVAESIRSMGSKVVPAPDSSRWRTGRHHPSHLGKRHAVGRARGDTGCSGDHPCLRAGTTRIVRHVTTRGEHYAHSNIDDRLAGVNERQGNYGTRCWQRTHGQELLTYHRPSTCCRSGLVCGLRTLC